MMTPEDLDAIDRRLREHPMMALNHADAVALVARVRQLQAVADLSVPLVHLLKSLLSTALPLEDGLLLLCDGQLLSRYVEAHGAP